MTHLIVRLNAVSEEKSTVSLGKEFQMCWQIIYAENTDKNS